MFLAAGEQFRRQGVARAITDRIITLCRGSLKLTCRKNRPAYLFYKTYNVVEEKEVGAYDNGDPMAMLRITLPKG
jgi:predicted acetyltransferase